MNAEPRAQGLRLKALEGTVLCPIAEAALRRAESLPAVTDETVAAAMAAPRGASGLRKALSRPGRRFILEVKGASPSLGMIRSDIDLEACARAYARHADAVSVLTEPTAFGGSFGRLTRMRALTKLPTLAKDVTVDERQIIGINHRNLRDLTIDLDRSARLALLVPGDRILVAESGIRTHADVERVARAARVFLVGSVLNQADDVSLAVRRLLFGEMKVCGITRADDAAWAALEGFSAAGVVLAKRSPRAVTPEGLAVLSNEIKERTKALGLTMPVTAVVDGTSDGLTGRSGRPVPQERLAAFGDLSRIRLAGGLTPENARAAAAAGAAGLDANSGVESAPGLKDPRLLALFAGAVRG